LPESRLVTEECLDWKLFLKLNLYSLSRASSAKPSSVTCLFRRVEADRVRWHSSKFWH
jgi:hypothetical protein